MKRPGWRRRWPAPWSGCCAAGQITVQTDQVWGRMPVVYDTVVAAFCIFAIASADRRLGLFKPGTLSRHAQMAAAGALFAGYLAGRA